ncbi:MAG TPA: hypothetical protein VKT29_10400 [Terriglobales bacterium]|nr:hypothetical protein [Terriglobales bacterium]
MKTVEAPSEEQAFVLFRRKVQGAEVLSASLERLLQVLRFTGRLSVVVQNGRILKSGYEEGYFRCRNQAGSAPPEQVSEVG